MCQKCESCCYHIFHLLNFSLQHKNPFCSIRLCHWAKGVLCSPFNIPCMLVQYQSYTHNHAGTQHTNNLLIQLHWICVSFQGYALMQPDGHLVLSYIISDLSRIRQVKFVLLVRGQFWILHKMPECVIVPCRVILDLNEDYKEIRVLFPLNEYSKIQDGYIVFSYVQLYIYDKFHTIIALFKCKGPYLPYWFPNNIILHRELFWIYSGLAVVMILCEISCV